MPTTNQAKVQPDLNTEVSINALMYIAAVYCALMGRSLSELFKQAYPDNHNDPFLDAHWFDYFDSVKDEAVIPPMTELNIRALAGELRAYGWEALVTAMLNVWVEYEMSEGDKAPARYWPYIWESMHGVPRDKEGRTTLPYLHMPAGTPVRKLVAWFDARFGFAPV